MRANKYKQLSIISKRLKKISAGMFIIIIDSTKQRHATNCFLINKVNLNKHDGSKMHSIHFAQQKYYCK